MILLTTQVGWAQSARLPEWVLRQPAPETQVQKGTDERDGVNPCNAKDPGFGAYRPWDAHLPVGKLLVPKRISNKRVDVMIHFHGADPARKQWVRAMSSAAFVGVDLGVGTTSYSRGFDDPSRFENLLVSVQERLSEAAKRPVEIGRIGLSSWSAGYAAVRRILGQKLGRLVDTVVLLDGLHTGLSGDQLDTASLEPFTDFASLASHGRRLMFVSHSSIIPSGYASTTQTASYLIYEDGGRPLASSPRPTDPMGLELTRYYVHGNFHVRGYAGNDKFDHCAQLGLYRDILRYHVRRRWR